MKLKYLPDMSGIRIPPSRRTVDLLQTFAAFLQEVGTVAATQMGWLSNACQNGATASRTLIQAYSTLVRYTEIIWRQSWRVKAFQNDREKLALH